MDELNTRLCSCFFSSPQFVPSVGGPWLNTQWRAVAQAAPGVDESGVFVHTSGMHPCRAYTPQRVTERRSRRIHIRDLDCPNPHQVAGPQYFSMDLDDALAAVRPDTLCEPQGPLVCSAEFAWRGPGHGASEHRCAPSRCFSVSDDRGRPLAG